MIIIDATPLVGVGVFTIIQDAHGEPKCCVHSKNYTVLIICVENVCKVEKNYLDLCFFLSVYLNSAIVSANFYGVN